MLVKHAKEAARQWVMDEASRTPGFHGAFYHGSINWLPDDALLPANSDVDIMVVLEGSGSPAKPGKLLTQGVLLEVTYLPGDQLRSANQVLGVSHLAGSLRGTSIILDPSGQLAHLQAAVSRDYAKRRWIYRRCEHARSKVLRNLEGLDEVEPFHDQVVHWLFATGVTTHILLVAGLRNPTVRKRYVAARQLLADYGQGDFYPTLLELLGCARITQARVEQHLAALAGAFDAASAVITTPFPFASDISAIARPIALDGSRELIQRGDHREAVFWMVATYSRCQKVLYHDAPVGLQDKFHPGYRQLLADLGIASFADLQDRSQQVKTSLPRIWEVGEAILAANPEIEEDS
jgi:hypothetical protein